MLATLAVIIGILFLLGLAEIFGLLKKTGSAGKPAYAPQPHFMSAAEVSFFGVLRQAVGDRATVMAKVRVADVIKPAMPRNGNGKRWQSAFNRISSKHFDFVLCSPEGGRCLAAVELDDKSHTSKSRRARDEFLDRAMRSAGVPLIHVPARAGYSVPQLRELLESEIESIRAVVPDATGKGELPDNVENACPKCGAERVMRTGKKGALAGKRFWGCSRYPNCREIEQLSAAPPGKTAGDDMSVSV